MDDNDAAAEAKRYRERAEALRATVQHTSHPDNRWMLLDGADAFDRLADFLEQNDRQPKLAPRRLARRFTRVLAIRKEKGSDRGLSEPCARDPLVSLSVSPQQRVRD